MLVLCSALQVLQQLWYRDKMGSLKEEMRGLREDHKTCEMADDGDRAGRSDGTAMPEGTQLSTNQESTCQGDYKLGLSTDVKSLISKDLSRGDRSDPTEAEDSAQTVSIPFIQQSEAEKTEAATQNYTAMLGDIDGEIPAGMSGDKNVDPDRENKEGNENISVPPTPGPYEPWSPAPDGQHHMRTQVSLEVVQCHSAATSPMTPPQGGNSFFFPSAIGRSMGSDTKDAELQVGTLVELCSVATSPMTPKTPFTTAFPALIGKEESLKRSEEQKAESKQDSLPVTESSEITESKISGDLAHIPSKEQREHSNLNVSAESSASRPAAGLIDSQVTLQDGNQHCKQQRMGSMDQDITITVTHYNNKEEEEWESSSFHIEQDLVKIDEYEQSEEDISTIKEENGKESMSGESAASTEAQGTSSSNTTQTQVSTCVDVKSELSNLKEDKGAQEDCSAVKPPVPESPAPFGCHNIRTQVSLEVVQCQSAATSPMTPPEGDQAFYFPSSLNRCAAVGAETKDAELQVGRNVEFRSVATAPMTPRTPTITTFPEISKAASVEEKIVEEDEDKQKQVDEEKVTEEENVAEKKEAAPEEDTKEARNCKEKCEEPVQEVSWDEKGMTWEVYGAVVEVTVLGSAIQKHLEKQVKKRQPSMPPPPPLNPSAMPLTSGSIQGGSGKGRAGKRREQDREVSRRRRNPFRLMMENMQQPHCCSKAHTTE